MKLDVLLPYVKDLKPTANENYVYTARDVLFGDVIFSYNSATLNLIKMTDISDDYLNKIFSLNCIKNGVDGFSNWFGVIDSPTYTNQYFSRQIQKKAMQVLGEFRNDIHHSTNIMSKTDLQTDDEFYNNILIRKSDEGAGRYICGDKVMYVAPCMLPGSKSTPIHVTIYDNPEQPYFVAAFFTHKKSNTIMTLMRFLKV